MRKLLAAGLVLLAGAPVLAHVTPNVQLVQRGAFIKSTLAGAVDFSERRLDIGAADLTAIKKATDWTPSEEDVKIYAGRDSQGRLVGTAVFLWVASEHGPLGVGVGFDPAGKVLKVAVTDVGTEPLAWVRPLLAAGGLSAFDGLALGETADPATVAPDVTGRMNRYYAEVITRAVARAQAIEGVSERAEATQP